MKKQLKYAVNASLSLPRPKMIIQNAFIFTILQMERLNQYLRCSALALNIQV